MVGCSSWAEQSRAGGGTTQTCLHSGPGPDLPWTRWTHCADPLPCGAGAWQLPREQTLNSRETKEKKRKKNYFTSGITAFQSWSEKVKCLSISLLWNPNSAPQHLLSICLSVTCPSPGSLCHKTVKQSSNSNPGTALANWARSFEFKFHPLSSLTIQHPENFKTDTEQHQPSLWF